MIYNDPPLVSVLLPTHNRADVLTFAIRSVLSQTIQDFELLIVGDGCTDNTAEIVRSFNDSRIKWFDLPKAPNFGYANRNIALKSAKGSLIAFMAHDDLWLSDHLEILLKAFEDEQTEIAYSRPLWVIPQGLIVPGTFNLNAPLILQKFLDKKQNEIPASCILHRKGCFSKYGYWDDTLSSAGDWDLWARMIVGGNQRNFVYVEEPTCLHFKANWHTEMYDRIFRFDYWKGLFAIKNFMPAELQVEVENSMTEQEAVWKEMSVDTFLWNKKIRSAIYRVLDSIINKNFVDLVTLQHQLLDTQNESINIQNQNKIIRAENFRIQAEKIEIQNLNRLIQAEKEHFQSELERIQSTFTWRLRSKVVNNFIFQKLYTKIKKSL